MELMSYPVMSLIARQHFEVWLENFEAGRESGEITDDQKHQRVDVTLLEEMESAEEEGGD